MFRVCAGCGFEFYGPAAYCTGCREMGEHLDEKYFDWREGLNPFRTVEAPAARPRRLSGWLAIARLVLVVFGVFYIVTTFGAMALQWLGLL